MTWIRTFIITGALLAAAALPSGAESPRTMVLNHSSERYTVGRMMEYLVDPGRSLGIDEIVIDAASDAPRLKWRASGRDVPSFGFSSAAYWVRFAVSDASGADRHWNLLVDYPHIDHITLYTVRDGSVTDERRSGDRLPFGSREVNYRNFLFPLKDLSGGPVTLYLRVETESAVTLPLTVLSETGTLNMISNEQFLLGLYYGVIALIIVYSLFIFVSTRDMSYLYYVLWIGAFGLNQITLNGLSFQYFWPNSVRWANTSLPLFIFLAAGSGLQFGRAFLHIPENAPVLNRALIAATAACAAGAALAFVLPYAIIIRMGTIAAIAVTAFLFAAGIYSWARGFRAARFYVIAFSSVLAGIMMYALKTIGALPENAVTNWSQQIGSALQVSLLSLALADRINIMNDEKNAAMEEKMKAQEKFRLLFDESQDIIFTLDEDGNFTSVNQAVDGHLHIPPSQVVGKNFLDIIFIGDDADEMTRGFIRRKLEELARERRPISFKAPFATFYSQESREAQVKLEYVSRGGRGEILGTATAVQEDILLSFFESERQCFRIGNYFSAAEDVSHRLTRNLARYLDAREVKMVRVALREMIINAVEHGNLRITYEEKSRALADGSYFDLLAARQKDARYGSRTVEILYALNPERAAYRITDQGDGFDYGKYLGDDARPDGEELDAHGRGIFLSRSVFDDIRFNRKGNQVLLVRHFNSSGENTGA